MTDVPNVIGIHALVWVGDTAPASVERAVEQTVASGYGLLEFSLHDSLNLDRAKTREMVQNNGIQARMLARTGDRRGHFQRRHRRSLRVARSCCGSRCS